VLIQLPSDFEVMVVDGNSTDGTESLLEQISSSNPRLRFQKQKSNTGLDAGYAQAANESSGKYIMFAGDDDKLAEGSLARVREKLLSDSTVELLLCNYSVLDPSMTKLLLSTRFEHDAPEKFLPHEADKLFVLAEGLLTFIGSVLVSRERWNNFVQKEFLNSYFIHVGAALSSPLTGPIFIEHDPVFLARGGVPSWNTSAAEIWLFKWPQVVQKLHALSHEFRAARQRSWRVTLPNAILWQRAVGNLSLVNLAKIWSHFPPGMYFAKFILISSALLSFRVLNSLAVSRVRRQIKQGNLDLNWELFELMSGRLNYLNLRSKNINRAGNARKFGEINSD
jgi:glycosyltransferase involved in cell wall biosynthesis